MSIKCGHCRQRHDTVDEVRTCSAEGADGQPRLTSVDQPEQPVASTPTEAMERKKSRPSIRIESYQPPPKLTVEDLERAMPATRERQSNPEPSPEQSAPPRKKPRSPRRKRARTRRRNSGGDSAGFYGFGPHQPHDAEIHKRIGSTQNYNDDT